jgi:predicted Fe-Mo cluster-binding NifX family protein
MVDAHFGRAGRFEVYELGEAGFSFVEARDVKPACAGGRHDESSFDATLAAIGDCEAVFVCVIGYGAASYLMGKGMRVFESPYSTIGELLAKVAGEGLLESGDRGQRKLP